MHSSKPIDPEQVIDYLVLFVTPVIDCWLIDAEIMEQI
jgi:hypothetical protein